MLRIALPGGKSLEQRTCELFAEARITVDREEGLHAVRFPDYGDLSLGHFLKPRRIPFLVSSGDFDLGLTGRDAVMESGADVSMCAELPYSRSTAENTRGVLFAHEDDPVCSLEDFPDNATVLSEYPRLTRKFFEKRKRHVTIVESPGSAEAEVPLKYRFGLALSETGRSLRANCLKVLATVFQSSTVLIANKKTLRDAHMREKIHALKLILSGVLSARGKVMLSMNAPKAALEQVLMHLPAITKPTLADLSGGKFVSVSVVVSVEKVNNLVPILLKLGVKGLITLPVTSAIRSW